MRYSWLAAISATVAVALPAIPSPHSSPHSSSSSFASSSSLVPAGNPTPLDSSGPAAPPAPTAQPGITTAADTSISSDPSGALGPSGPSIPSASSLADSSSVASSYVPSDPSASPLAVNSAAASPAVPAGSSDLSGASGPSDSSKTSASPPADSPAVASTSIPPSSPVSSFTSGATTFSSATTASDGVPLSITSASSLGTTSSSSPASKSASTTSGYSKPQQYANGNSATALCNGVNKIDAKLWKENNVDKTAAFLIEYYPTDSVTSKEYDNDISFPEYMANTQGSMAGNLGCKVKDSSCLDALDTKVQCRTDARDSPIVFAILVAIQNFWKWQDGTKKDLRDAKGEEVDRADLMVQYFTDTDIGDQGKSNYLTIAAGVLILMTAFLGPVAQAVTVGGSVLAGGIMGAAQKNAAQVLSNQFKNIANVKVALSNTTDVLVQSIESIATHVLETPPSGDDPSQDPNGAAQILKDGAFAKSVSTADFKKAKKEYQAGLSSLGISDLFAGQSIFFIMTDTSDRYKKMDMAVLQEDARACDDDHCFFAIVDQPINLMGSKSWKSPIGLNKLGEFGINLLDLAKAALWYQKKFGGYMKKVDFDDLSKSFLEEEDKPPKNYWVSLPVVDYDDAPSIKEMDVTGHTSGMQTSVEDRVISTVGKYIAKKDDWPYKDRLRGRPG